MPGASGAGWLRCGVGWHEFAGYSMVPEALPSAIGLRGRWSDLRLELLVRCGRLGSSSAPDRSSALGRIIGCRFVHDDSSHSFGPQSVMGHHACTVAGTVPRALFAIAVDVHRHVGFRRPATMKRPPNHAPAPNRRPPFPLGAPGEFMYHFCAPPSSPAAVGEAQRSHNEP